MVLNHSISSSGSSQVRLRSDRLMSVQLDASSTYVTSIKFTGNLPSTFDDVCGGVLLPPSRLSVSTIAAITSHTLKDHIIGGTILLKSGEWGKSGSVYNVAWTSIFTDPGGDTYPNYMAGDFQTDRTGIVSVVWGSTYPSSMTISAGYSSECFFPGEYSFQYIYSVS